MMVRQNIDLNQPLEQADLEMLKRAAAIPASYDEDCPELTDAELKKFQRIHAERSQQRNKQTVTLRLSPQALNKAKSLGKGYTSVLSRILESALSDNKTIEHFL